jgi:polyisoprenoid-binding protein YceI
VHGRFGDFTGRLTFDEANPAGSKVEAVIQAASVDTDVEARDKDLRSKRFFDVDRFPTIEFRTTRVEGSGKQARVIGELTMHGVTKQVSLDTEFLGKGKDPWGNERYGFHAETTVNRKDFGMTWNEVVEAGGVLVGDEVEITLDVEAVPAP